MLTMRMAPIEIDSRLPVLEYSQLYDIAMFVLFYIHLGGFLKIEVNSHDYLWCCTTL